MLQTTPLSVAQSQVFSRAATYRLRPALEHLRITSIDLVDNQVKIETLEGDVLIPKDEYVQEFIAFRSRVPDFFDYVGPQYETRRLYRPGLFFLPIGWVAQSRLCAHQDVLLGQHTILNTLKSFSRYQELVETISYPGQQYGYLVSHEGLPSPIDDPSVPVETPWCSCGSFQGQWMRRQELRDILGSDYQPTCKHIAYLHRFDQLRSRMSVLLSEQTQRRAFKTLAWWYMPPERNGEQGVLRSVYIDDQPMRSLEHWSLYTSPEPITGDRIWSFFDTALDHGYSVKYAMALPTLRSYVLNQQTLTTHV
jgi:hypothetical protein